MSERISRSARKRRFQEEEKLAAELAELSDRELESLDISQRLCREVRACRGLKGGSRKRQVKYLAKVLRSDNMDAVFRFLEERKGSKLKENQLHMEAERLRDSLINETIAIHDSCLQEEEIWDMGWTGEELQGVIERLDLDERDLRRSLFQFARTRGQNHYRETYRILRAALEKERWQR